MIMTAPSIAPPDRSVTVPLSADWPNRYTEGAKASAIKTKIFISSSCTDDTPLRVAGNKEPPCLPRLLLFGGNRGAVGAERAEAAAPLLLKASGSPHFRYVFTSGFSSAFTSGLTRSGFVITRALRPIHFGGALP